MNRNYLTLLLLPLLLACRPGATFGPWTAEDESNRTELRQRGDTLEIDSPEGVTLWYAKRMTGDYRISYRAEIVETDHRNSTQSDLGCFWAACDPLHPGEFFARTHWRRGIFHRYNSLDLFHVGAEGSDRSALFFRRCHGDLYGNGRPDNVIKPLLSQYSGPLQVAAPGQSRRIEITVRDGQTHYAVDGHTVFTAPVEAAEGEGYFGLRLFSTHVLIYGLKIERL